MVLKHILDCGDLMVKKKTNLEKQAEKQALEDQKEKQSLEKETPESKDIDLTEDERKEILKDTFADMDENERQSESENLAEIIKAWLDDAYIHAKTRLNQNQIIALTILKTLAEKYSVSCIKDLIDNFVRYKLSEGGQSSKELVDILKARTDVEMDDSLEKAISPFIK